MSQSRAIYNAASVYLQRPGVGGLDEEGLEALVGDEGEAVHGEDVRVAAPDPRHRLVAQLPHLRTTTISPVCHTSRSQSS